MPSSVLRSPEPIAGYTLKQRIGAGGYGEVWKVDAPGGLTKAMKFVFGCLDEQRAACELKALNRIKEVRHPFLLSLERIEVVDGQLVIITELADQSLKDRFEECKKQGAAGIGRAELLVYLRDAADALDYMSEHYSLQHLDVKPENLLVLGGRVKVADFGLVKDIHDATVSLMGGLTPIYASPEVYEGRPSLHSDQYSLAIVYQEMLTGVLPFPGRTPAQLAAQHLNARPRLGPLPEADKAAVARALSKDPADRFPSCRAMVEALLDPGGARGSRPDPEPPTAEQGDTASLTGHATLSVEAIRQSGQPSDGQPADPSARHSKAVTSAASEDQDPFRAGLESLRTQTAPPLHRDEYSPTETYRGVADDSPHPPAAATPPRHGSAVHREATPGARPRDKASAASAAGAPAVINAEPIVVRPGEARFRPTLVVGVGGLAARVLRQFRGRLHDRFGRADALPAVQTLLIDSDAKACAAAARGDEATALGHADTVPAPLRAPHEYRNASRKLLGWLSRRWLYNIPRSLQTEGIRPLGRLALVDHAAQIVDRLRQMLKDVASPDAHYASARVLGLEPAEGPPRVFVVSSICGGTGSGMVLDLGYAIREILGEIGYDDAPSFVHGLLVYGTGRGPNEKQVAAANAHSLLTELSHCAAIGHPGDPALQLPASPAGTPAFDTTHLLHLGDELDESQFESGVEQLADYLFLNAATSSSAFFDRCRDDSLQCLRETGRPDLRTFGLRQVGTSQSGVLGTAMKLLARTIVERWLGRRQEPEQGGTKPGLGGPRPLPSKQTSPAEPPVDEEFEQHAARIGINREAFVEIAREVITVHLGAEPDEFFSELFNQFLDQAGNDGGGAGPSAAGLLRAIREALGLEAEDGESEAPNCEVRQPGIEAPIRRLGSPRAEAVGAWILKRVDAPDAGLPRARQAAGWFIARLRAIEQELRTSSQTLQTAVESFQNSLLDPRSTDRAHVKSWLSFGRVKREGPKLDEGWMQYAQARVEQLVLSAAILLARVIRAQVSQVGDRLADLQRELTHLADQFDVPSGWGGARRELGLSPAEEARQEIARALRARVGDMASSLESHLRESLLTPHGGLCGLLEHGAALRPKLVRSLRAESRTAVSRALNEIRVAGALAGGDSQEEDSRPFRECFEECRPRLMDCGGTRRLLIICPDDAVEATRREAAEAGLQPQPTVLPDASGVLLMCQEVERIGIDKAAQEIIEDRRDILEISGRVHTRVDIAWRKLTR